MSKEMEHMDQFDALVKGKLDGAASQVPPGVWESVQSGVSSAAGSASGVSGIAKMTLLKWAGIVLVPAALVTGLVVMNGSGAEDTNETAQVPTEAVEVQEGETQPLVGERNPTGFTKDAEKKENAVLSEDQPVEKPIAKAEEEESKNQNKIEGETIGTNQKPATDAEITSPVNKKEEQPSTQGITDYSDVQLEYPKHACLGQVVLIQLNKGEATWYLNGSFIKKDSEFRFTYSPDAKLEARVGTRSLTPAIQLEQPDAAFTLTQKDNKIKPLASALKGEHSWYLNGRKLEAMDLNEGFEARDGSTLTHIVFTSDKKCADTAVQTIEVQTKEVFLDVIPNFFSPNKDGHNDEFEVRMAPVDHYRMMIRDYAGNVVFETENQNEYWNGKRYNLGETLPGGRYTYLLVYVVNGKQETKRGIVTIKN